MEREYKLTFDRTTTYYVRDAQGTTLATYTEKSGNLRLSEQHLYGANRLGMRSSNLLVATTNSHNGEQEDNSAEKRYELTNHLGNVLAVVSGEKKEDGSAQILSLTDYYPFGMEMDGRKYVKDGNYRYGFQGQEKENEYTNFSSHYAFEYRINDTRLGRFLSVDPLSSKYPYWSPYAFSGNQVINMIELEGLEPAECGKQKGEYQVAAKSGTENYYGWTWSGKGWSVESPTMYNDGRNPMEDTNDDLKKGLTKTYVANAKKPIIKSEKGWFMAFWFAYSNGISIANKDARMEALYLFRSFVRAEIETDTKIVNLLSSSGISKIMEDNEDFKALADVFENNAIGYFRANNSLTGFDGSKVLDGLRRNLYFGHPSKSKETELFLLTVMGGIKCVSAKIKKIDKSSIEVEYKIWDHFGAGWDDTDTNYIGLAQMSYLQHYIPSDSKYKPFVWNVTVDRKRNYDEKKR